MPPLPDTVAMAIGRNGAVVLRGADHPSRCLLQLLLKLDQGWIAFLPFSPWGEQGEIQPGEIEQVRPPLTLFGRRHEALGQFQVFAIAGSQDQEIWSGRGHPFVGRLN